MKHINTITIGECRTLWGKREQAAQYTYVLNCCTDLRLYNSSMPQCFTSEVSDQSMHASHAV